MKPNATKGSWNTPSPPARLLAGYVAVPPSTWSASVRPSYPSASASSANSRTIGPSPPMSPKGKASPRCMVISSLWLVAGFPLVYRLPRRVSRHRHRPAPARRGAVIKLGYKASAEQFAPGKLLGFSCLAEEVGFDSVFISDHFQPWKHVDGHAPFSLTWLGALGARTSRVVIGTSVLTPTFRYHPSIVAQAFGTMGAMFPGRVVLGIGTGEGLNEVLSTGQPWPEFKERFARLREAVTLIRALWTQELVSFEGQYYKTEKATIYDRPDTPVPIYVAAAGALVARYAGRSAEGFICTSGKKSELYTETLLPKVAEGIAASEDPLRSYDRMIEVKVSFDTDKVRALEDTRHWAALALTPEEKMTVDDPVERERPADGRPLERAASRWIVSSDADEHTERIGYYVGLGFRNLVFHAPGPDQARFLKLYGEHVLPRLRKRSVECGGAADETQQCRRDPRRPRHSAGAQGRRSRRLDRRGAGARWHRATRRRRLRADAEDRVQGRRSHGRSRDRRTLD